MAGCHRASQGHQGRAPCAEGAAKPCWGRAARETAEVRLPRAWPSGWAAVRLTGPAQGFIPSAHPCSSRPFSLSKDQWARSSGENRPKKVRQELLWLHLLGTVRALGADQLPAAARFKQGRASWLLCIPFFILFCSF